MHFTGHNDNLAFLMRNGLARVIVGKTFQTKNILFYHMADINRYVVVRE
jgi:hypothetical protein